MPRHSILIAAYNRLDCLKKTIYSCLASQENDFELIINDDASEEDNVDSFYDYLINLDSRIKVIRNSDNLGVGKRFSELHDKANGEILHVIGSDDLLHPCRLNLVHYDLERLNDKRLIWCSSAKYFDSYYKFYGLSDSIQNLSSYGPSKSDFLKVSLIIESNILHPTVSYFNRTISLHHNYEPGKRSAVDYNFFVDNFFNAPIYHNQTNLTYIILSKHAISRSSKSRFDQLNNHDHVMHKLWNRFITISLDEIRVIRNIVVTNEPPRINYSAFPKCEWDKLYYLVNDLRKAMSDWSVSSECNDSGIKYSSQSFKFFLDLKFNQIISALDIAKQSK